MGNSRVRTDFAIFIADESFETHSHDLRGSVLTAELLGRKIENLAQLVV